MLLSAPYHLCLCRLPRLAACLVLVCLIGASSIAIVEGAPQGELATVSSVQKSFSSSALRWQVPVEVLLALGYVESRWEQRHGEPSIDKGYGIMHLVNDAGGSLQRAAVLTGLSEYALKNYVEANIEGGAAVLNDISLKMRLDEKSRSQLIVWYDVVAMYSGANDPLVRDLYAKDVFDAIRIGRSATLSDGEKVVLAPSVVDLPAPSIVIPTSDDYDPAFWVPAHSNNYRVGRPYGPLSYIVVHDTEGSYNSAISWFQNPNSGVSAHYIIRSSDGQVTQMVRNADTGYHAGNWDYNVRSIGIEHEGFMNQQGWYTEAMYQRSSHLARTMADRFNMRKDRAHIVAHSEVPGSTHNDPGPYWNWDYYMGLVRRDSLRAALVDNTDPGFRPTPPEIDPQHYWWTYGNGYGGSSTYVTTSVSNQSGSVNSGEWSAVLASSGFYDVYAFIPWVDNNISETSSARYRVSSADGEVTTQVSQRAITDVGTGSWAHLGRFRFTGGATGRVNLSDYTGETGRNVWFDAVMWIPAELNVPMPTSTTAPPTIIATATRTISPTRTPTRTVTRTGTATRTPTYTPTHTFTPAATWTPGPCGIRFTDLPDTHWAYEHIAYLFCRSVVSGYADGTFRVNSNSTRAQFAKMITLAMNWAPFYPEQPTFTDVSPDNGFYGFIEAAYIAGILGGYEDGTFRPTNPVTRAQVAKMIVLAKLWDEPLPPIATFIDVPRDHWAFPFVEAAYAHGIIGGYSDGTYRANLPVTRAQLSKMLALAMQQADSP